MDPDSLSLCFQDPTTDPFYEQILTKAVFSFSHFWDAQSMLFSSMCPIDT